MSYHEELFQRVDEALERGQAWRAKEMLRGNIGSRGYDQRLYERYGQLLIDLGEMREAGKYLLLAGANELEYEEPIRLFIGKESNAPISLYEQFPKAAKLATISDYPREA